MLVLIWIQPIPPFQSDIAPEFLCKKSQQMTTKHANLPSMQSKFPSFTTSEALTAPSP